MTHKEMCIAFVEARKKEDDQGRWWWIDPFSFRKICGPYPTEQAIDDVLWAAAFEHAHEVYLP